MHRAHGMQQKPMYTTTEIVVSVGAGNLATSTVLRPPPWWCRLAKAAALAALVVWVQVWSPRAPTVAL
jgi:hypothetical protein